MIYIWLPFLSAIAYRLRGSEWTGRDSSLKGLRVAKLAVGAAPVALACWLLHLAWPSVIGVLAVTALADCLPHGAWQGTTSVKQVLMMSVVGIASALPAFAALWIGGSHRVALLALACGVATGPATWIGNKIPLHFNIGPVGFNEGPEWGEVARGFVRVLFAL